MNRDYYAAELREAERLLYRAQCRVRCLEANLDRIDLEEFDSLMESLEAARQEAMDAGFREVRARIALHDCEKKLFGAGGAEQP